MSPKPCKPLTLLPLLDDEQVQQLAACLELPSVSPNCLRKWLHDKLAIVPLIRQIGFSKQQLQEIKPISLRRARTF